MRLPCRGPEGLKAAFIFSSPLNPAQKAMLMRRHPAVLRMRGFFRQVPEQRFRGP